MKTHAFISLGGNLGNTLEIFEQVYPLIENKIGKITRKSSLYQTAAWGVHDQQDFLNQVIEVETPLDPTIILDALLAIEHLFGRERKSTWGPRNIDLDVLCCDQICITSETLVLPHPRMTERNFVLIPFAEIAPWFLHPVLQQTIEALREACTDSLPVTQLKIT